MASFGIKWSFYLLLIISFFTVYIVLTPCMTRFSPEMGRKKGGDKDGKGGKDGKDGKGKKEEKQKDRVKGVKGHLTDDGKVRASHKGERLNLWDETLMQEMIREWREVELVKPENERKSYYSMQKKYEKIAIQRGSPVIPYTTVR